MRRNFLIWVAVSFLLPQQPANRGTFQGIVLRGASDEPVANASINLGTRGETTTDSAGRFVFENLEPGEYRLLIRKSGYVEQVFPGQGAVLRLAAGQSPDNLTIRLTPTGIVTGRLVDGSGQPVGDVPVRLLDETNTKETISLSNDRGEYRFFFVTPGKYRLTAGTGSGAITPRSNGGAARRFNDEFDFVYYPGGTDRSLAQFFNVKAGEELSGMDMVMGEPRPPAPRAPVTIPPPVASQGAESAPVPPQNREQ